MRAGATGVGHAASVSDECEHEGIFNSFGSRRSARRQQAIRDAYIDLDAHQPLAKMLDESSDLTFDKVVIAAHLATSRGTPGTTPFGGPSA